MKTSQYLGIAKKARAMKVISPVALKRIKVIAARMKIINKYTGDYYKSKGNG